MVHAKLCCCCCFCAAVAAAATAGTAAAAAAPIAARAALVACLNAVWVPNTLATKPQGFLGLVAATAISSAAALGSTNRESMRNNINIY